MKTTEDVRRQAIIDFFEEECNIFVDKLDKCTEFVARNYYRAIVNDYRRLLARIHNGEILIDENTTLKDINRQNYEIHSLGYK